MWRKFQAIWRSRLGYMGQKVQHMHARSVSAASGKWLHWTYSL